MSEQQINFDVYSWTEVKTSDNDKPGLNSNSINELLKELSEPPPPVDTSEIDKIKQEQTGPQNNNGQINSEINSGGGNPTGPAVSQPTTGQWGTADPGQKMSANLLMKGFDTAFASAGVMITGRSEMYELYKAAEKDLKYLSDSLAEVFAYYGWKMEPLTVFGIGLAGVYTTKGFQIAKDYKQKDVSKESLQHDVEIEQLRAELAEIRNNNQSRVAHQVNNSVTQPGNKRGPKPGTHHPPGSKKTGPKPKARR